MLQETWNTFPRQIVQKINGLLEQAHPTKLKAFHIYKMCKNENLWKRSYSEFSFYLESYFNTHPAERSKSQFDQFLDRPMDWRSFESIYLTFRTADIRPTEIRDIACWAHHMLRLHYQKTSEITSVETLSKTIYDLTHPEFGSSEQSVDFEDFCEAWKSACDKLYGKKYEAEHKMVISELRILNNTVETQTLEYHRKHLLNRVYLTQTEITWVEKSLDAAVAHKGMAKYPLSKGPTKPQLVDLLKWLTLWEISKTAKSQAVQKKVEKLRIHIINICEDLLMTCRR